jgi:dienelactone hydrolase
MGPVSTGWRAPAAIAALLACLIAPAAASAFSPDTEVQNWSKVFERERYVTLTPEFQALLAQQTANGLGDLVKRTLSDPERLPANVCGARSFECAGDVRFYDWPERAGGIRHPVVFTARSGATISGDVWATRDGPARRPVVVITTGSVQAPETLYWGQAATLAEHGYVVMTYDVQGQGLSDTLGEAPDTLESVPAQAGEPFYDGTEDALDFLLSTPDHPYEPRPSCTSGTSHAPKQDRRVAAGLDDAYDPLSAMVDASRVGIAGHSLGAAAVSFIGQEDPRVDAIVAWDNLSAPDAGPFGIPSCASAPETRQVPPITKPALGISNDYGIVPLPLNYDTTPGALTVDPDPDQKSAAFDAYRAANTDSGELVIRGGCHEESAFIPGSVTGPWPLGCGTLRGGDLIAWYTTAWFDKYVKGDATADSRLLTERWRDDPRGGAVDLAHDPNLFSFYFHSPLDIGLAGGGRASCSDLRAGCPSLAPDGLPPDYDFVADAHGAAVGGDPGQPAPVPGEDPARPASDAPAGTAGAIAKRKACKAKRHRRTGHPRRSRCKRR